MDTILDQLTTDYEQSFSFINFLAYIIICALLLFILSVAYKRFGQSMSNRVQLSKVLIIVGLTTFIIISIVKSSLALSLGLVGALSIVRFRTAIKEPEELGYFFIAIAIGLGMGANQLVPTLLGFAVLFLVIVLMNRKGNGTSAITQNLLIRTQQNDNDDMVTRINDIVGAQTKQLEIKRIQHSDNSIAINYLVKVSSMNDLNTLNNNLRNLDNRMDITFIDNTL